MQKILILFFLLLSITAFAQDLSRRELDKTQSPYFVILSDSAEVEQLPLKATDVEVNIAGMIADVTVRQTYRNEGNKTIEAIYTFPTSTRAAVYSLVMNVGKKRVVAKIKEKGEARRIYETAKSEGKTASLLVQERPNVFTMNVANILPNDSITLEMSYTETLLSTEGIYQFVYPSVVGPRYGGSVGSTLTPPITPPAFNANPYTKEGIPPTSTFTIHTTIQAGIPVSEIKSSSHAIKTNTLGETTEVELTENEQYGGNRDFILNYQLRGNAIQSGLLTYEEDGEKFFLLNLQPPIRVEQKEIVKREYIFIIDVSGSMSGFPLEISKKIMEKTIMNLQEHEKFNIILFAGGSDVYSLNSIFATPQNKMNAIAYIKTMNGGGGTELLRALETAYAMDSIFDTSTDTTGGFSRSVVILTDGLVTVEKPAFQMVRNHIGTTNVFAFGIGSSVNRYIIEGIAYSGLGEHFVVTKTEEADSAADMFYQYIQSPLLTDIQVDFGEMKVKEVQPAAIPDMFAARPLYIFGKYEGKMTGEIKITGKMGGKDTLLSKTILAKKKKEHPSANYAQIIPLSNIFPHKNNRAIRYLWAREIIKWKDDYEPLVDSVRKKEITDLGLKYHLMTDYTSFVAVYEKVRNKTGEDTTIHQVLPLPQGVSNQTIGNDLVAIPGSSNTGIPSGTNGAISIHSINSVASVTGGTPAEFGDFQTSEITITAYKITPYELDVAYSTTYYNERSTKNRVACTLRGIHLQTLGVGSRRQMVSFQGVPIYWGNDRWGVMDKYSNTDALKDISIYYAANKEYLGYESPNGSIMFNMGRISGKNSASISLSRSFYGENHISIESMVNLKPTMQIGLIGAGDYNSQQVDRNKDGFLDIPKTQNMNLLPYYAFRSKNSKFSGVAGANYIRFTQQSGQHEAKANPYQIGEKTAHEAYFAKGMYIENDWQILAFSTYQNHQQQNYAGLNTLSTQEKRSFSEIRYIRQINHSEINGGLTYLYWQRNSYLIKEKDTTAFLLTETAPTLFGSCKWEWQDMIADARISLSFSRNFGLQFLPQFGVIFPFSDQQLFYINGQRFFYPQNALSENINLLSSGRSLRVIESLKPESGKQAMWGYRQSFEGKAAIDIFMGLSYFDNKIVTDFYAHNDSILISNLHGKARTFTTGFKFNYIMIKNLDLNVNYFFERSMTTMSGHYVLEPLIAQQRAYLSTTYRLKPDIVKGLQDINFGVNANTFANIPYFSRDIDAKTLYKRSTPFALINFHVENVRKHFTISLGINNLLNYRPKMPIQNSATPFANSFDASQIYTPMLGRNAALSLTWKLGK